jgi:hypothetical protein
MSWVVFCGPTIASAEVAAEMEDADVRGPAACGDVLRACDEGVEGVVIVDGYFEHRLAVWHKEILWALASGIRVYGASSLGALRAVELEAFGMVGVGRVFEWFRDGFLEDDDEVTLVHEPVERGYRPLSEALVNIRATLGGAVDCGVLTPPQGASLVAAAKEIHYPLRSLAAVVDAGTRRHPEIDWPRLRVWLEEERIDLKKRDARLALQRAQRERRIAGAPQPPGFHFEYTEAWHQLRERLSAR